VTSLQTWTGLTGLIQRMTVAPHHTTVTQVTSDTSRHKTAEQARIAFSHVLPHLDGANLKATVVEVTYGPGQSPPPHSHLALSSSTSSKGGLRTQVQGEAEATYKAGQSFYEASNGFIGSLPTRVANLR
jgi:quercetin dioxygenase-like cupin family protein